MTLKPAACSVCRAAATRASLRHLSVAGPFDTETSPSSRRRSSCRPVPGHDVPLRLLALDVGRGRRRTPPPGAALPRARTSPTTDGTATGFGPFETLIRTFEPATSTVPGCGSCAVTVSAGWAELTPTARVEPALRQLRDGFVGVLPTTSGTVTFGFPVETRIVTMLPSREARPRLGLLLVDVPRRTRVRHRRTFASKPSSAIRPTAFPSRMPVYSFTAIGLLASICSWTLS